MHDNNTVQQLSDALNELLDAYDKLKNENTNLQQENSTKDNNISELEARNRDLEEQIEQLTDTTAQHTNEIDTMLGRIKTILDDGSQEITTEPKEEEQMTFSEDSIDEEDIQSAVESEISIEEQITMDIEQTEHKPTSNSDKEIDLGRMQSLLNGFNN